METAPVEDCEMTAEFRDALRASGLEPPDTIEPGKLHRFPGAGKRPDDGAGWCLLFDDGLGGSFGDWSSGFSGCWHAAHNRPCSRAKMAEFAHRVQAARRQSEAQRCIRQVGAAMQVVAIWNAAIPAPGNHPYLVLMRVQPHGARIYMGALTLPVMDFAGKLTSLQFIADDGNKRLLADVRKYGCFIPVAGEASNPSRVVICECWATGCIVAEDEPAALVLAAIDAENLESIAVSARHRWPTAELVIAGGERTGTFHILQQTGRVAGRRWLSATAG